MELTVNKSWFVHWHHDLYGPFTSEEDAKKFIPTLTAGDGVAIYYLPFVEFEGHAYVLDKKITACDSDLM